MRHPSLLRKEAYLPEGRRLEPLPEAVCIFDEGGVSAYLKQSVPKNLGFEIGVPRMGSVRGSRLEVFLSGCLVAEIIFTTYRFSSAFHIDDLLYAADAHSLDWVLRTELSMRLARLSGPRECFPHSFGLIVIDLLSIAPQVRGQLAWKAPLHAGLAALCQDKPKHGIWWMGYQPIPLVPDCEVDRKRRMEAAIRTPARRNAMISLYARHIGADYILTHEEDPWMVKKLP